MKWVQFLTSSEPKASENEVKISSLLQVSPNEEAWEFQMTGAWNTKRQQTSTMKDYSLDC